MWLERAPTCETIRKVGSCVPVRVRSEFICFVLSSVSFPLETTLCLNSPLHNFILICKEEQ